MFQCTGDLCYLLFVVECWGQIFGAFMVKGLFRRAEELGVGLCNANTRGI